MRAAQIIDGVVVNIIAVDDLKFIVEGTLIDAGSANIGDLYDGITFSSPPVDMEYLKSKMASSIESSYLAAMQSGFTSSALGLPHRYSSDGLSMVLLVGAASTGVSVSFECTDENGLKEMRLHTAEQMRQVLNDGAGIAVSLKVKKRDLLAQIESATTEEVLGDIVW